MKSLFNILSLTTLLSLVYIPFTHAEDDTDRIPKIVIDVAIDQEIEEFRLAENNRIKINLKNIKEPFFIHISKDLKIKKAENIIFMNSAGKPLNKPEKIEEKGEFVIFKIPTISDAAIANGIFVLKISREEGSPREITVKLKISSAATTKSGAEELVNRSHTEGESVINCGDIGVKCPDSTCVERTVENNFGEDIKNYDKDKIVYIYDFNKDPAKRAFYKIGMVKKPMAERIVSDLKIDEKELYKAASPIATNLAGITAPINAIFSTTLPPFADPNGQTLTYTLSGTLPPGTGFDPATRILNGTPTQAGSFDLSLSTTNQDGLSVSSSFTLTVTDAVNRPPASSGISNITTVVETPFTTTLPAFTDPDGNALTYTLIGIPPKGLSFDPTTRVLSGTPTELGIFSLSLWATDPDGLSASKNFTLQVNNPGSANQLPIATNIASITTPIHVVFSNTLPPFVDPNGQPLNYILIGTLPPGLIFNPATQMLTGTPTGTGNFSLTLQATDPDNHITKRAFTLRVSSSGAANNPPIAPNIAAILAPSKDTLKITLPPFTDPDGQPLKYALIGIRPAGLNFNPITRVLRVIPTQAGVFNLTLWATDSKGLSASSSFTLRVKDEATINQSPIATNLAGITAPINAIFSTTLPPFADPNGQTLTYTLSGTLPPGTGFDPATRILNGTPTQAGSFDLSLSTANQDGLSVSSSFTLTVTDAVNRPPASSGISNITTVVETPFTTTLPAFTDPDGNALTYTLIGIPPKGLSFDPTTRVLSGTPTELGIFSLSLWATDPEGLSASKNFTLQVNRSGAGPISQTQEKLRKAENELRIYNRGKMKDLSQYTLRTSIANFSTEALKARNHVQFKVININKYFYDVSIDNQLTEFESEASPLFDELVIGKGDIVSSLLSKFTTSSEDKTVATAAGNNNIDLNNLIDKIKTFLKNYNQLQAEKIKAYNPCVYFDCCVLRDYSRITNNLMEIKIDLAKLQAPYVDKANELNGLKQALKQCEIKSKELEEFGKANDIESIKKKKEEERKPEEKNKLKEYEGKENEVKTCSSKKEEINNSIEKLTADLKPYRAIVDLYESLPNETDLYKLIGFIEHMTVQNQTYIIEQPTLNGDRLDLTIDIHSKNSVTDFFSIPKDSINPILIQIPIIKRAFVSFSSGAFVTPGNRLQNITYDWQPLPSNNVVDPTNSRYVLAQSGYTAPIMGFAALANLEYRLSKFFGFGSSMGIGLTIETQPRPSYLLGGSIFLGELRQFAITGGLAVMQVDRLPNNFQAVYNQQVNYTVKDNFSYYRERKSGWFISLTFTPFKPRSVPRVTKANNKAGTSAVENKPETSKETKP